MNDPNVQLVAEQRYASPLQVALAWALRDRDVAVIAPITELSALRAGYLELEPAQMDFLDGLDAARPFQWNLSVIATA